MANDIEYMTIHRTRFSMYLKKRDQNSRETTRALSTHPGSIACQDMGSERPFDRCQFLVNPAIYHGSKVHPPELPMAGDKSTDRCAGKQAVSVRGATNFEHNTAVGSLVQNFIHKL